MFNKLRILSIFIEIDLCDRDDLAEEPSSSSRTGGALTPPFMDLHDFAFDVALAFVFDFDVALALALVFAIRLSLPYLAKIIGTHTIGVRHVGFFGGRTEGLIEGIVGLQRKGLVDPLLGPLFPLLVAGIPCDDIRHLLFGVDEVERRSLAGG